MSRGVGHSASDQVSRNRRLDPTGYGRRVILRIITRILPPECRCRRSFVTSDGMGGAVA